MRGLKPVSSLPHQLRLAACCCAFFCTAAKAQDEVRSWHLLDSTTRDLAESIEQDKNELDLLIAPIQIPITGSIRGFQTPPSATAKASPPIRVQFDFLEAVTIDAIALYPAIRPSLTGPRSLGMPDQLRISFNQQSDRIRTTFSLSPQNAPNSPSLPAYVTHDNAAPNSPLPVWIQFAPRTVTSVTLLIPELALISNHPQGGPSQYACLFSEIEIYQGQTNIAPQAKLSSPDSLEDDDWGLRFLCDTHTPLEQNSLPASSSNPNTNTNISSRRWASDLSQRRVLVARIAQSDLKLEQRIRQQNFILSIAISLVITVLLVAMVSNWILSRRRQLTAVMTDRERIANDLHDEVGGALGSISLLTQKLIKTCEDPVQEKLLHKVHAAAAEARAGVREAVWASSPSSVDNKTFENHLRAITDRMLPDCKIVWHSNGSAITPTFAPRKQHHFGMFFREAIHNIQKHANASAVTLSFRWNPRNMIFTLSDNGDGLDNLPASSENFRTLRYRAEQLPAKLELDSNPNGGTRFTLTTPLT